MQSEIGQEFVWILDGNQLSEGSWPVQFLITNTELDKYSYINININVSKFSINYILLV